MHQVDHDARGYLYVALSLALRFSSAASSCTCAPGYAARPAWDCTVTVRSRGQTRFARQIRCEFPACASCAGSATLLRFKLRRVMACCEGPGYKRCRIEQELPRVQLPVAEVVVDESAHQRLALLQRGAREVVVALMSIKSDRQFYALCGASPLAGTGPRSAR